MREEKFSVTKENKIFLTLCIIIYTVFMLHTGRATIDTITTKIMIYFFPVFALSWFLWYIWDKNKRAKDLTFAIVLALVMLQQYFKYANQG